MSNPDGRGAEVELSASGLVYPGAMCEACKERPSAHRVNLGGNYLPTLLCAACYYGEDETGLAPDGEESWHDAGWREMCEACGGTGYDIEDQPCASCDGEGYQDD